MPEPASRNPVPAGVATAWPPRRARWRVAVLGLIGALALVLPLAQVLRFQVEDLLEHRAERTRLDPLTEALALHRGLAGHDAVATRVLGGRAALEGERREHKAVVDRDLAALQATLWAGDWPQARREATGLQADWRELAAGIEQRAIDAATSQQGHRLLQEQAVQVMDFVIARAPDGALQRAWLALPPAARPAAAAALLPARRQELDRHIAAAESTRALLATALLALLLLAAAAAVVLRRHGAPPPPGGPALRVGHGRRAGDRPPTRPPAAIAADELQALRRSAEDEPSRG